MSKSIPILYGTETGNAEFCAEELVDTLAGCGVSSEPVDMGNYSAEDLANETFVIIVTSTYGNGDPPSNAKAVLEFVKTRKDPLSGLKFAVCALGDSSYPYFAQCGKDFDAALGALGAERVIARIDCDEDYEDGFAEFSEALEAYFNGNADVVAQYPA